jgi:geranylgeranyl diphosphate synthase type II
MTTMEGSIAVWLDTRRGQVEEAMQRYLPGPPQCPSVLYDAMHYSLLAGGKRLRPLLTLAAAEAVGAAQGNRLAAASAVMADETDEDVERALELALPAACAIEMIHTYSLIHDDLPAMDDDSLRRGRPTSHVQFGEGQAILAGDGLLTEAFALLAREPGAESGHSAAILDRKLRTIAIVAHAAGAIGMVGGQAIDLHAARPHQTPQSRPAQRAPVAADAAAGALSTGTPRSDPSGALAPQALAPQAGAAPFVFDADSLRDMHARKTGALIRAAAVAGAVMAGASRDVEDAIAAFATELGLAFQIVDDVLDVEGTAADLGKTAGKDAASGKPTYPALFGLDRSKQLARDAIDRAYDALDSARISGRLPDIAAWVVKRTN